MRIVNAERLVLIGVLALIVAVSAGAAFAPAPLLRLDVIGGETFHLAVPDSGEFVYRYRHSVYDVLVEERLRIDGEKLRQVEIRSADRRALEDYGLPFEPERKGGLFVTKGRPDAMPQIDLIVLHNQEQEILLERRAFDLSKALGDARLTVRAVQTFRAAALLLASR